MATEITTVSRLLSDNLMYLIRMRRVTQNYVAQTLGISKGTVSSWCSGSRFPDAGNLQAIANLFDVEVASLFDPQGIGGSQSAYARKLNGNIVPVLDENGKTIDTVVRYTDNPGNIAIKVNSTAMTPTLQPGDIVVLNSTLQPVNGSLVAVQVGQSIYLRRFYHAQGVTLYHADNEPPLIVKEGDAPYPLLGTALFIQHHL